MVFKIQRKIRVALPMRGRPRPEGTPTAARTGKKHKGKRPPASGKRHQQVPGSSGKKKRRLSDRAAAGSL